MKSLSLETILLFSAATLFQLAAVLLLPAAKGMGLNWPTLGVALGYAIGVTCMARLIISGVDLSLLIPLITVAIMLSAVAAGVVLYGDKASLPKVAMLVVAAGLVGVASRY